MYFQALAVKGAMKFPQGSYESMHAQNETSVVDGFLRHERPQTE